MKDLISKLYSKKSDWLLYFLFLAIFLSLDTSYYDIFYFDPKNFKSIFLNLRLIIPYCIFILFIFVFKNDLKFNFKLNFFTSTLIIILASQIFQIFSTILSDNSSLNLSFIFNYLMMITLLIVAFNQNKIGQLYFLALVIITIITLIYGCLLIDWLVFKSFHKNLYGSWPMGVEITKYLSTEVPRSSGIARSSLIIIIPLSLFLIIKTNIKLLHYIFYFFFIFLLLTTQSRLVMFGYLIGCIIIIIYIFQFYKNFKKRVINIILLIFLPIMLTYLTIELKYYLQINTELIISKQEKVKTTDYGQRNNFKSFRKVDPESFSSRRFDDWKEILKNNKNVIFGYGALGDRYLINQSASSIFFYSYASGGFISLFIFILIIIRSIYTNSLILFKFERKLNRKNYYILSACLIQIFLIFRSIFESSFAVFGIDFIFFFVTFFFTEKYLEEKTN